MSDDPSADAPAERMRLDKWLWHARFFRTRTLAAEAVAGGKVRVNGRRSLKPGAGVKRGDILTVRRAGHVHVIEVKDFGVRRGPAAEASRLYVDIPADPETNGATAPHLEDGSVSE